MSKIAICVLALLVGMSTAMAQTSAEIYPSRVVRLVVPYPPGGVTNTVARILTERLTPIWGQNVVIDNRPGANGITGTSIVAKADRNGYTLGLVLATHVINPLLYKNMPYSDKEIAPVSLVGEYPLLLVVNSGLKIFKLSDFEQVVRAESGRFTFASSGNGSSPHLAVELLKERTGIELVHVPYKGGGLAIVDVGAGHVNAFFSSLLTARAMMQAGRIRVIATTGRERSPALPDVPTIAETYPGYSVTSWLGLIAPAGTQPDRVHRVYEDVFQALQQGVVKERLRENGVEPRGTTPSQFSTFLAGEREKFSKVIRSANITFN
jgi:tripartite-type tricarboxylate transporter receptor subunit TctC